MLGDKRGRAGAGASWSNSGMRGTHNMGWSRPWSTRISLHMLSSFPLTFFFRMALSAASHVTSPGTAWAEGLLRGHEGEQGSRERVGGGGEGRREWAGGAALSEGSLFWWYVPCCAMPNVMSMRWGLLYIYCIVLECIHREALTYHIPWLFRMSQS